MNKYNFYYRCKVGKTELNQLQADIESEVESPIVDFYGSGIVTGVGVTATSPPSMSVSIASGVVYNNQGRRVVTPTSLILSCTNEGYTQVGQAGTCSGSTIPLPTGSNKKYITILLYHAVFETDLRTDGYGNTLYFRQLDSFRFRIIQGTEAENPSPPSDPGDGGIILADILLYPGMTQIQNTDISTTRRNYILTVTGRVRKIGDTMTGWLQFINSVGIRTADTGGNYKDAFFMNSSNQLSIWDKILINSDGSIQLPGSLTVTGNINSSSGTIKQSGNDIIPTGAIIIWKGNSCPNGYVRDDDFAGRFPMGAAVGTNPGDTGGASTHTHTGTTASGGSHDHGASTGYAGEHNHGGSVGSGGSHSHGGSTGTAGGHSHGDTSAAGSHNHSATVSNHQHWLAASDVVTDYKYWEGDESGHWVYPILSPLAAEYGSPDRLGNRSFTTNPGPDSKTYYATIYRYTEVGGGHSISTSTISNHVHSTSSVSDHSHSISSVSDHTHSVTAQSSHAHSISSQSGHTHSFTSDAGSSLPPYRTVLFCRKS